MSVLTDEERVDPLTFPGIEIAKRKHGDLILVTTDFNIFEIEVLDPSRNVIRLSSTDRVLHKPKVGVFTQSVLDDEGTIVAAGCIKQYMRMQIRFLDRVFQSSRVTSAAIRGIQSNGQRFTYEVF